MTTTGPATVGILLSQEPIDRALSIRIDPQLSDELLAALSEAGVDARAALSHSDAYAKLLMYLVKPQTLEVLGRVIMSVAERHNNKQLRVSLTTGELEAIGYSGREAAEFLRILRSDRGSGEDTESTAT